MSERVGGGAEPSGVPSHLFIFVHLPNPGFGVNTSFRSEVGNL